MIIKINYPDIGIDKKSKDFPLTALELNALCGKVRALCRTNKRYRTRSIYPGPFKAEGIAPMQAL